MHAYIVWSPYNIGDVDALELIQHKAAVYDPLSLNVHGLRNSSGWYMYCIS